MIAAGDTLALPPPSLWALVFPPHPPRRTLTRLLGSALLGAALVVLLGAPLWLATACALALLVPSVLRTWQHIGVRYGRALLVLSVLVTLQSAHTLEHIAQVVEFHLLGWAPRHATGLLSGLNVELVHFVWNWAVLLGAVGLLRAGLRGGPRNLWGWLFLLWTTAHTLEHSYLLAQYLVVLRGLWASGASLSFAEGLPGVLGRGGWLATHAARVPLGSLVCRLTPAVVTAPRLDIHFWWNVGETLLLLRFAHRALRGPSPPPPAPPHAP